MTMTKTDNDPKTGQTPDPDLWSPIILIDKVSDRLSDFVSQSLKDLEDLETLTHDPDLWKDWKDPISGVSGVLDLETAKSLTLGQILYSLDYVNSDQTPQRYKVNGRPKTWKTRLDQVKIPVKRGLYEYGYIWHYDLTDFSLSETYAKERKRPSDSEILIKSLASRVSSLQSLCITIGDQIRDFDSGHTWIRPDRLTKSQTEDLESLSRVSRGLSLFLRSIIRDLKTGDPETLEILRSSHLYLTDLYGDPESLSLTRDRLFSDGLRELTVSLSGQILKERPEDPISFLKSQESDSLTVSD